MGEREGLIARIREIRRASETADGAAQLPTAVTGRDDRRALAVRIEHLEQLVQGLQDAVYRESSRQAKRVAEVEARVRPGALGTALSKDARARGM